MCVAPADLGVCTAVQLIEMDICCYVVLIIPFDGMYRMALKQVID